MKPQVDFRSIIATCYDHVCGQGSIVIRGINHEFYAHLYLWKDGLWRLGDEQAPAYQRHHALHMYRVNSTTREATEAARKVAWAELEPALAKWAKEHPSEISTANAAEAAESIDQREEFIREAKGAIAELEAEIERIRQGERLPHYVKWQIRRTS